MHSLPAISSSFFPTQKQLIFVTLALSAFETVFAVCPISVDIALNTDNIGRVIVLAVFANHGVWALSHLGQTRPFCRIGNLWGFPLNAPNIGWPIPRISRRFAESWRKCPPTPSRPAPRPGRQADRPPSTRSGTAGRSAIRSRFKRLRKPRYLALCRSQE